MTTSPVLLSMKDVARRLTLSRPSIYKLLATDPRFPRPIKIVGARIAFVEAEVSAYIEARLSARDEAA